MPMDRRAFTVLTAASVAAAVGPGRPARARGKIKAIAFDGFPIIDARPVFALAEEIFPGKGLELSNVWRTRQFEYTWLRTLGGNYTDFWHVTEDALAFAARMVKIELSTEQHARLMQSYLSLKAWPDVVPALKQLRDAGIRMAFLSNLTNAMLDAVVTNSALGGYFESHLSTDLVGAFKPDRRAYQMGVNAFKLPKEEIVFAAFGGWDAVGAKWFGYPTFWVNRAGVPVEELGVVPDGMGAGLADLVKFVIAYEAAIPPP